MTRKRMSRKSMKGKGKKPCGGKRTKRKGKKKRGGGLFDNMPGKQVKKGIKTVEKIPKEAVSLTEKGLDTGVGVVEDIGKVIVSGQTAIVVYGIDLLKDHEV